MTELLKLITTQSLVCTGLVIAMLLSIMFDNKDLAINIASGLIGFLSHKMEIK